MYFFLLHVMNLLFFFKIPKLIFRKSELTNTIGVLLQKLNTLKHEQTKLVSRIVFDCSVKPMMDSLENFALNEQSQFYVENFLKLCHEILDEKQFLCYYEEKFGLSEHIELMYQISGNRM